MLEAAFLVLRECAELLLIAWAAQACLVRARREELVPHLRHGIAAGAALGIGLVVWIVQHPWSPRAEALLSMLLGASVLFMATAMLSSKVSIRDHVGRWLLAAIDARSAPWIVAAFLGLAALRETVEIGLFLHAAEATEGWPRLVAGALAGGAATALAALAFRTLQSRIPLLAVYRLSSLLLCLLAIELTLGGLGQFLATFPALQQPGLGAMVDLLTPEHTGFRYLCIALMVVPGTMVFKRWWTESTPER
ncbi:FTR1 family protein [Pseudorhodoferax sp.]|uniref:FTR1 family protein n=1 Tax=Pseudorhodoferax sp. TaxID=1993553 RepID=UPI002DD69EF0|nr:FTR1 family protein [Pseudorhodoferax sp.]